MEKLVARNGMSLMRHKKLYEVALKQKRKGLIGNDNLKNHKKLYHNSLSKFRNSKKAFEDKMRIKDKLGI